MFRPCLWTLWPLAVIACSPSSSTPTQQSGGTSGGGTIGSTSGSQSSGGESGNTSGAASGSPSSGAASSSGSGSGSASGATVADAAASGADAATEDAVADEAGSEDGGACAGLFCEDFEEGQINPAKWNAQTGAGGTQMVEQEIVAHGNYAWHVHGTGAGGDFATILTKSAPMALQGAGPIFGRAYLYATANYGAHIQLGIAGTNPVDPTATPTITPGINFNYMEFAEFSNSWQVGMDLFTPAPSVASGFVEEASYPPAHNMYPTMTWNCVEWEFGDNPDMMLLWFDGTQIDQFDVDHIDYSSGKIAQGSVLNGKSSGIIGGYTVFGFGFHSYGSSMVVDRYYDDIVLDTKRVGCIP